MAQDYDKIIKENLSRGIIALTKRFFNLDISRSEELEVKLQYTVEREPDFLRRVIGDTPTGDYGIQIEFQATNGRSNDMIARLLVYFGMVLRQHNLPLRQYVIYVGNEKLRMNTEIRVDDNFYVKMNVINLKTIDCEIFLQSRDPEEVIFAILADYKNRTPTALITDIALKLKQLAANDELSLKRYAKQLRMLAKLRKFDELTYEIINDMTDLFNIKEDFLYLKGEQEGREEGLEEGLEKGREEGLEKGREIKEAVTVVNMFLKTDFVDDVVADLAKVNLAKVNSLRKEFEQTRAKAAYAERKQHDRSDKNKLAQLNEAVAKALTKMKSIDSEVIAQLTDLTEEEVVRFYSKKQEKDNK